MPWYPSAKACPAAIKPTVQCFFPTLYQVLLFDFSSFGEKLFFCLRGYRRAIARSAVQKTAGAQSEDVPLPLELVEVMDIDCPRDYLQLVPYGIPEPFTVKEFAKEVHIRASLAQVVLQILAYAGVVERVGKKGNAYLYKVLEGDE